MRLPAPGARTLFGTAAASRTSSWSLFSGLIIVLAGATLAAAAFAVVRRGRGNPA